MTKQNVMQNQRDVELFEVLSKLDEFEKSLEDLQAAIDRTNKDGYNIFNEIGMSTQEIKHSAYLASLFDSKRKHGLGINFLIQFLDRLYDYEYKGAEKVPSAYKSNKQILSEANITKDMLMAMANENNIEVKTETVVMDTDSDKKGRTDIILRCKDWIIVIENKTFTSTHDDQLQTYQNDTEIKNIKNKVFVYLTPKGELPADKDKMYNSNWCIFDYEEIVKIIEKILLDSKTSKTNRLNSKTKIIIEDYKNMVNIELLKKNAAVYKKCKTIREKYRSVLEILDSYTDSLDEVYSYIKDKFSGRIHIIPTKGKKSFDFYTDELKNKIGVDRIEKKEAFYRCGTEGGDVVDLFYLKENGQKRNLCMELLSWEERFTVQFDPTNSLSGSGILRGDVIEKRFEDFLNKAEEKDV